MIRNILSIVFFLMFYVAFHGYASNSPIEDEYYIESFTNQNGLSHNAVRCLFQDSKGFLWIGTNSGLNRYDGKDFLVYKNDPLNKTTLSSNNIFGICEDKNQNIWIATEYGLNQILRESYECRRFSSKSNKYTFENELIQNVFCDNEGIIWIKTGKNISKITPKNGIIHSYELNNGIFDEEIEQYSCPIFQDSQGTLWIGTENGLGCYEQDKDEFIFFKNFSNNRIHTIYEDQDYLWIGTENGLNLFDKKTKKTTAYFYAAQSDIIGISGGLNDDILWIATERNGIFTFDTRKKTFTRQQQAALPSGTFANQVNTIIKTRDNLIWIGSQNGLYKLDIKKKRFLLLSNSDSKKEGNYTYTTSICINDELVFFGTKFGGLQIYDMNKHTKQTFSADKGNFPTNYVTSIIEFSKSQILIGGDGILLLYDKNSKKFDSIDKQFPELDSFCLAKKRIKGLLLDSRKNLWIGTNFGVTIFNTQTKEIKQIDRKQLPSNQISCFYENYKNKIFIGCENGVSLYDYKTNTFKELDIFAQFSTDMQKHVYDISEDYEGYIWIGTNLGLIKYNPVLDESTLYTTHNGLVSNEIFSVQTNNSQIWIGTDNGLAAFYADSIICKSYSLNDGIQDYEFSPHSAWKMMNGYMLFGGTTGINIFHPDSITATTNAPNLEFLQLEYTVNDKKFERQIFDGDAIVIPWNNSNIKISFAALEFTRPEKNQYKYFISGQTDQWIDLKNQNYINIIKLPEGSYTLKILASNSDGIWSEEKSIQIRVKPPFWRTTAAYIIEILTLTIIVLLAIQRSRKKLIEENHRLTERQAWTEKLEEQQTELENKNRNILDSITYAKRIQMAIMPARARFKQILPSSFILYIPKDIVSGDFYWITEIDTKIFIVCSDCTGHGVPGAFMSIIGYNLLRNITKDRHIHKASEILDYLNKSLIELLYKGDLEDNTVVQDGMDISICVFDKSTCVLEFAGALSRMLIYRDNQFITVKGDKYPVGLSNDQDNPYTNIIINVQPNDRFYMFSDGYSDQFGGENGKKLKFKRFKSYIEECQQFNLPKQGVTLKKMLQQWQGNWEQVDDILVMGFDLNIYLEDKQKEV